MTVALVALAAALGAVCRYLVQTALEPRSPHGVPWGTWVVNVSGACAVGLLIGVAWASGIHPTVVTVLGTGFLGAYTTFSSWMVEGVGLLGGRHLRAAAWHLLGSLVAGVAATAAGLVVGGRL